MTFRRREDKQTEGIVINTIPIGESDRVATLITPQMGLFRGVGRRARVPSSKLCGCLDVLKHVRIMFREGRTLASISQAETLNTFSAVISRLDKYAYAVKISEIAAAFSMEGVPNVNTFNLFANTLRSLETLHNLEHVAMWFQMRVLSVNGYQPELFMCVDCSGKIEQRQHLFSVSKGGISCPKCSSRGGDFVFPLPVNSIKWLRFLSRSELENCEKISLNRADMLPAKRVLNELLHQAIGRKMKSDYFTEEVSLLYRTG